MSCVACAVEIQRRLGRRNQDVVADRRLEFRLGINIGDVIADGGDVYGGGVNVAVRLEGMCDPGGILVSENAYQQVHDKLEIEFQDRGPQNLKNIAVRAYAVEMGSGATAAPVTSGGRHPQRTGLAIAAVVIAAVIGAIAWQATQPPTVEAAVVADMAFPLPDKPSIAVLAFENLSTADDELLADSFSEDILASLSKLSGLFVISRTTSFTYKGTNASAKQIAEDLGIRYVLEGSIQRDGDSIRVTAQLIDAIGGQHVWADRYDRDLDDLFAVKDVTKSRAYRDGRTAGPRSTRHSSYLTPLWKWTPTTPGPIMPNPPITLKIIQQIWTWPWSLARGRSTSIQTMIKAMPPMAAHFFMREKLRTRFASFA